MSDKQIVAYVKDMIINNLASHDCWKDAMAIGYDETNELLIAHIDGIIALFTKAKEILEKEGGKNE